MKKDLVDFLLTDFCKRPGMYLGTYSLSPLSTFVTGFMIASGMLEDGDESIKRFSAFYGWFQSRHNLEWSSTWVYPFLQMKDGKEKEALELFLSELEIFASENSR